MKPIVYCKECDHRYENLDGTMECMRFECLTVEPDDFCAWGEYGEGTKERQRTKEEEEEFQRWLDSLPTVMASSATFLDFIPKDAEMLDTDWLKTGIPISVRLDWQKGE